MTFLHKLAFAFVLSSIATVAFSRELPARSASIKNSNYKASLEARLTWGWGLNNEGQGGSTGMVDCWNAMMQLKSRTSEIVLFFINGESHLGLDCCRAIRTIIHHCWPSMISSLGFTAEEGDILRGYCDAETGNGSGVPHAATPPITSV